MGVFDEGTIKPPFLWIKDTNYGILKLKSLDDEEPISTVNLNDEKYILDKTKWNIILSINQNNL